VRAAVSRLAWLAIRFDVVEGGSRKIGYKIQDKIDDSCEKELNCRGMEWISL
jgi:hypothetical protein